MNSKEHLPRFYDTDLPISAFITKKLIGVDSDASAQAAAKKMSEFNISSLVIVNEGEIVGFLTEGDIRTKVVARGLKPDLPVEDIMSENLITVDIGTSVEKAALTMADQGIKHLLVEEEGEVCGILSFRDLIDIDRQNIETHISRE